MRASRLARRQQGREGDDRRMTSSQEPPQPDTEQTPQEAPETESQRPARRERPPRPRAARPEPNPALDPRLARLERQAMRSRTADVSLLVIGLVAFVFGVAMYYWVGTTILDSGGDSNDPSNAIEATVTPAVNTPAATVTVSPQATATPLPDRTNCDEIRGTQYRSVAEREFFLANCTGG